MRKIPSREELIASVQKCSDMMPRKEFDNAAETVQELAGGSMSATTSQRFAKKMVADNKWEKVWKLVNGKPVPAYRIKRK